MLRAMELKFSATETLEDDEGRKRWRLPGGELRNFFNVTAEEMAALDLAILQLERSGFPHEAKSLEALRDKVRGLLPKNKIARLEPDCDALLEARGFVARPGPRPKIDTAITEQVVESIKACRYLNIFYKSRHEAEPSMRRVAPYGLLAGNRRYLVAHDPASRRPGTIKTYRMDAIVEAEVTSDYFTRPPDFDIHAFAEQGFGLFQRDGEIEDVIWRFSPKAAEQARGFIFHSSQVEEDEADGSYLVRFRAAGWLEMIWFLYSWGDAVEVLAPEHLRNGVEKFRRSDFPALP